MRSEEVADSTDSTLIVDKIAPVHKEVQKTSFARNIYPNRLGGMRLYLFTTLFFELDWAHSTACALSLAARAKHRGGNDGSDRSTVLQDRARNDTHHASRATAIHERAGIRGEGAT